MIAGKSAKSRSILLRRRPGAAQSAAPGAALRPLRQMVPSSSNHERPHQALAMKVPADLDTRSPRVYRGLEELSYTLNTLAYVRFNPT